jgi:hypothetical protein
MHGRRGFSGSKSNVLKATASLGAEEKSSRPRLTFRCHGCALGYLLFVTEYSCETRILSRREFSKKKHDKHRRNPYFPRESQGGTHVCWGEEMASNDPVLETFQASPGTPGGSWERARGTTDFLSRNS